MSKFGKRNPDRRFDHTVDLSYDSTSYMTTFVRKVTNCVIEGPQLIPLFGADSLSCWLLRTMLSILNRLEFKVHARGHPSPRVGRSKAVETPNLYELPFGAGGMNKRFQVLERARKLL